MLELIVLEHLVDGIDQAAGHPGSVELPTQVSVDFVAVSLLISALSASRFLERAGAVA
jgi:hypothetical protein